MNPHASPAKHVVIFVADTLRADRVPPLADRRLRSPSLEAHAQGAMVFERAYAASNWTKPSVATLMTGVLPQEHRALTHNARLEESYVLIGERLQEAGFYTAGVVTNGYVSKNFGFGSGWDRMLHSVETSRSRGDLVAADVARVLRERPKDRPLFLYIHTTDVHAPYSPPRRDLAKYDARAYRGPIDFRRNRMLLQEIIDGIIPLGLRDRDRLVALYDGGVTYHDRQFARIRQALERSGILGEALVVFTSDHGEELFDHDSVSHGGYRLHEELVRVPLLVSGPGIEPKRRKEVVSLVDVVPTVLHATGLPPDSSLVGRSLLGAELEPRPAVFETQGIWGLFDGRFKLVRTSRDGAMRLFDLVTDPEERRDIAAERPREVERLRALYAEAGRRQEAPSPAPEPAPSPAATDVEIDVEIDEATEARLRELGYIR